MIETQAVVKKSELQSNEFISPINTLSSISALTTLLLPYYTVTIINNLSLLPFPRGQIVTKKLKILF